MVAGWGQVTQPRQIDGPAKDPMDLMVDAALAAAKITGSTRNIKEIDGIMVVKILSRHYSSPDRQLSLRLGSYPRYTHVSGIGGNSPQMLINIAAGMIARNELDSVLIAGAETYVERDPDNKNRDNALFKYMPEDYTGDDLKGATPDETTHGIITPSQGFPLFETALWARSGLDFNTYMETIGSMWSSFSRVAAQNPFAWSRIERSTEEIIDTGPSNRPIAFPYPKYMNAFVTVDQGAAILLMSEEKAARYTASDRETVYFSGGGYAQDRQRFMIEKSDFTVSPPLRNAAKKALSRADISLEEIDCFDLYSCFPCAVTIAKKMLGISDDDKRPLTLTGGLGFFGGPGNNYSLHSAATLVEKISKGEASNGMITALGWFMHKHAAGIYSAEPLKGQLKDYDIRDQQSPLSGDPPVNIKSQVDGKGTIDTYTVIFDRNQAPAYTVIYGTTHDQFRFIANTKNDPDIIDQFLIRNMVGKDVNIRFNHQKNINIVEPV